MDTETQNAIENEITFRRTVDAVVGIHPSGTRITGYRDIVVRPSDNPGFNADQHDLSDPAERNWWEEWCKAEGEFQALRATHTQDELEAIARKAGYADWSDVEQRLTDAADDDGIISIQQGLVNADA